jgi:L-malate glycosyltransferase
MKICYLANASSIHTRRWAEAMQNKGCSIDIISFEKAEIKGVNIHYIKPIKSEISINPSDPKSISYMLKAHKVKNILKNIKPDIVHAHYATGYGLVGALCGVHPYIISTWGSDICRVPKKSKLFRQIVKYNLSKADYITATSNDLTRETLLYTNKQVLTIPFGVDVVKFSKHQNEGINTGKITIGIVKSLEDIYGIQFLIEAFAKINSIYNNTELIIVGNGPLREKLEKLCCELKISDRVIFTGGVANNCIPDYLNKMDIFVMPSLIESFGVAILEAESCGIPIIASDVGGIPEVMREGQTGFLVKPGNSDIIAEKLSVLIRDKKLREKMGVEGRRFVEKNYNWNDNIEQMYNLYNNILENSKLVNN